MKTFEEKLKEWEQKVLKASQTKGGIVDKGAMLKDIDKILSEEFNLPTIFE